MLAGMPVKDLARYSGVSARALAAWREKADNEGFSSLRAVKQTGRPKGLSDSQIAEIKDVIANDPEPSGYGSWTGRALSEHIESAYGLKYSARTCQKLLRSFRSGRCFLKEAGHYRSTVCWFPQSRRTGTIPTPSTLSGSHIGTVSAPAALKRRPADVTRGPLSRGMLWPCSRWASTKCWG